MNNKIREDNLYCFTKYTGKNTGKKSAYFKNVNKSGNNFYPDVKILS